MWTGTKGTPETRAAYSVGRGLVWLLAALQVFVGLALAWITYQRARLPYNEAGRYFEDGVVYRDDAVLFYGIAALGCLLGGAGLLVWLGWRSRRSA